MPIIEYFHPTKMYRVSVAKTVEWGTTVSSREFPDAPYAPFVGVGEDECPDVYDVFEYPVEKADEAFAKMADLWNDWKKAGFPAIVHA